MSFLLFLFIFFLLRPSSISVVSADDRKRRKKSSSFFFSFLLRFLLLPFSSSLASSFKTNDQSNQHDETTHSICLTPSAQCVILTSNEESKRIDFVHRKKERCVFLLEDFFMWKISFQTTRFSDKWRKKTFFSTMYRSERRQFYFETLSIHQNLFQFTFSNQI